MPISITRSRASIRARTLPLLLSSILAGGCALTPRDLPEEQARLAAAGAAFEPALEQRVLPAPSSADDWGAFVHRALLANGELEAAYFEWKAALEKVRGASAWPNTNVAVGYETMFDGAGAFTAGFDPMENLAFPTKTKKAGEIALEEARAAAERFRAAKFSLQRRVLEKWLDMVIAAERERIRVQRRSLSGLSRIAGSVALTGGESSTEAVEAGLEELRRTNEIGTTGAELLQARAVLASMTAVASPESIGVPARLPRPRTVPDDRTLLLTAAGSNPELAELAAMVRGRQGEIDLARMQWIPDISPSFSFEDLATEVFGIMATLPTTVVEIRSSIAQAAALRSAADARLMQAERDRMGEFLAAVIALRNAERVRDFLQRRIIPLADTLVATARSNYVSGQSSLAALVEAHEAVLDARLEVAESAIERERRVAEVEALAGVDMEAIVAGSTALASMPARREGAVR